MVKLKFWKFSLVWISKRVLNFEEKIRKVKNVLLFEKKIKCLGLTRKEGDIQVGHSLFILT